MTLARQSLLREWDWLQQEVVPPLVELADTRPVDTWSVGSVPEAVAVTAAFAAAERDRSGTAELERIRSYASDDDSDRFGFALADMACVPDDTVVEFFSSNGRKCLAARVVAERVFLSPPASAVDLVVYRAAPPVPETVVSKLRHGGRLVLSEPVASPPPGVEPAGNSDRVFTRHGGDASDPVDGDPLVETLALKRLRRELIGSHERLARSLARRFARRGVATEDLEQVALYALTKAAHRFDPERNVAFATYATSSILGELKRYFRDKAWVVKVPRSAQELFLRVQQAREELGHQLGGSPRPADIADHLGVDEEAVLEAMEAGSGYSSTSLDAPGFEQESTSDIPFIDPAFERALDRQRLEELIPRLDGRECLILKRIFFDNRTQDQVAQEMGISQMQVSRIRANTLAKLRNLMVAE